VQLLPGQGETVGARLIGDERVMGVMFTGSTEVAASCSAPWPVGSMPLAALFR
jgi:L-proline dehydrogenase (EC 1.5.99.8)/delta-1-pyrroline-5-carboxylate dehydrogenase (EC 1.5.1.12)